MKNLLFPFTFLILAACGGDQTTQTPHQPKTDTVTDGTEVKENITVTQNCYAWIKGKDTITLSIEQTGNMVTGEMNFLWYERDSNHGTVKGEMKGDTLILDYTFMAEGMESVRNEFLLKKNGAFVLGIIDYEHDQEPYKAKDAQYTGEVLRAVNCK